MSIRPLVEKEKLYFKLKEILVYNDLHNLFIDNIPKRYQLRNQITSMVRIEITNRMEFNIIDKWSFGDEIEARIKEECNLKEPYTGKAIMINDIIHIDTWI